MPSEGVPETRKASTVPWARRAGLSGKLLVGGGLAGLVAGFLPLATVTMRMGPFAGKQTAIVADDWRGKATLLGSCMGLALAWLLFPPEGRTSRPLARIAVGVGGVAAVLAFWLFFDAMRAGGGSDMMGMGAVHASVGIGALVNLAACAAIAAGTAIKGREERLF